MTNEIANQPRKIKIEIPTSKADQPLTLELDLKVKLSSKSSDFFTRNTTGQTVDTILLLLHTATQLESLPE